MHLSKRLVSQQYGKSQWILLNTLTGAVDVIDKDGHEHLRKIKEGDFSTANGDFVKILKKRGYLFENESEEDNLLKKMFATQKKKIFGGPIKAVICPTYACNMRCTYCFQEDIHQKAPPTLNYEEITLLFKALDEIVKRKKAPGAQIQLFGGEPLLSSTHQLVEYILKCSSKRDYPVGIVTNGVNLLEFKSILKKYQNCVKTMQITVDGPEHIHNKRRKFINGAGTFARIVEGIDSALNLGIHIAMRVNVDLENVDFLPELTEFISTKGWDKKENFKAKLAKVEDHKKIATEDSKFLEYTLAEKIEKLALRYPHSKDIFDARHISRTLGQLSTIVEKKHEKCQPNFYYCEATSTGVYVFGADGLLYPCTETAGNPSFAIGKFIPHLEIDERKFKRWQDRNILKIPECNQCSIALLCGGGCMYETIRIGQKSRMTLCSARKKQVKKYIQSQAKNWIAN